MSLGIAKEKKKKKKLHRVTDMGPTKNVKNIEWWQVSDGAKRVKYFKVMSDENWVMKKSIQTSPNLPYLFILFLCISSIICFLEMLYNILTINWG